MSRLTLLSLLITMPTLARGTDGMVTSTWRRLLGNSVTVDGQALVSESAAHCCFTCKSRPGCTYFCYNPTAKLCYVSFVQTSPITMVASNQLMCYRCRLPDCCPLSEGYILHNGDCIKLYTSALTNAAARDRCALDGSHLYDYKSVDTSPEYASLLSSAPNKRVWLGAYDHIGNGTFVWSDGSAVSVGSPMWDSNQPDSIGVSLCMSHWGNNMLNDASCTYWVMSFICQIDG